MTHTSSSKSLVIAALLGIGMVLAPSLTMASDSAAKIQPVDPATVASYGGTMPLLSSGGGVVTGNAWCDPLTGVCLAHAWNVHKRF